MWNMELPRLVVNVVPCVMTLQPKLKGVLGDYTIVGPIHDAKISLPFGRHGIEVQVDSPS